MSHIFGYLWYILVCAYLEEPDAMFLFCKWYLTMLLLLLFKHAFFVAVFCTLRDA